MREHAQRRWVNREEDLLSLNRQCDLLGVSRSWLYAKTHTADVGETDVLLCRLIDEQYTNRLFYGSRRMVIHLGELGYRTNRKHVQRLMRQMGLAGMVPGPHTSRPHPGHKVYPYLLRGLAIERPNQVWSTDITYLRLARGYAYLVAILDWYSRKVLAWDLSNSLEANVGSLGFPVAIIIFQINMIYGL